MTKKALSIFTLVFPVLVMGLMIGVHIQNKETGTLWRVPVTGYDPRDLLRGHYLTYRYDWNWESESRSCANRKCVLCLNEAQAGGNTNPLVSYASREAAPKMCASYMNGRFYGSRFEIGPKRGNNLRRYYIPEEHASRLDRILRNWSGEEEEHDFEIGLRVNSSGGAFIEGMYIDDVPLEEWVKREP